MSGFHHSGMSGFDASMVYDDDEILTLVKGLEACESTQEAYKYIKKIKDEIKTLNLCVDDRDDHADTLKDEIKILQKMYLNTLTSLTQERNNVARLFDENKALKDENKALKAALPQSAHKCEKCGCFVEVVEKYVEGICDEDGELWWCIDCYDYHQEHGW